MDLRLDHIGVAVESLDEAVKTYAKLFGIDENAIRREENLEQKVRIGFVELANCRIELVEALDPESAMGRSIATRGEGIHHFCVVAGQDLDKEAERLEAAAFRVVSKEEGKLFFLHPKDCRGSLIEFYSQDHA